MDGAEHLVRWSGPRGFTITHCEGDIRPSGASRPATYASFCIGETTVMASDGRCEGRPSFQGFSLSLTAPNEAEAERLFAALADGGHVQMPLTTTFFPALRHGRGPLRCAVDDRRGVLSASASTAATREDT